MSLLLRMPIEIRYMIYEFVLYNRWLYPVKEKGSDKYLFCTQNFRKPKYRVKDDATGKIVDRYPESDLVSLSLVCRPIYEDLQARPVFYEINSFEFTTLLELEAYLAHIAPQKRAAIHSISLSMLPPNVLRDCFNDKGPLLKLLTQCKNIKEFVIVIVRCLPYSDCLTAWVEDSHRELPDDPDALKHTMLLWNLPFVRYRFDFVKYSNGRWPVSSLDLGRSDVIPPGLFLPDAGETFTDKVQLLNEYAIQHRRQIEQQGERNLPKWFMDLGENPSGPVSSGTRGAFSRFIYGDRKLPYYNYEGVLTAKVEQVYEVFWKGGSEIECCISTDTKRAASEPLQAILNHSGCDALRAFYWNYLAGVRMANYTSDIKLFRVPGFPSPRDVYDIGDLKIAIPTIIPNHRILKSLSSWHKLIRAWDKYFEFMVERRERILEKEK
ncbi:hypothetical protein GGR53DRAFT_279093 [Hypoxylon sp. FL1150]|nr:hypothetical protein GGR53DRAFT_279093 [Hypoxylon sp. FL1150]